jgi:hypothetical protein
MLCGIYGDCGSVDGGSGDIGWISLLIGMMACGVDMADGDI